MGKRLYVRLENGLANRLISLISSVRISYYTGRELILISKDDESFSGKLTSVVNLPFLEIKSTELNIDWSSNESSILKLGGRSFYRDSSKLDEYISGWHHFLLTDFDLISLKSQGDNARLKIESDLRSTGRFILQNYYCSEPFDVGIHIRTHTGNRDIKHSWSTPNQSVLAEAIGAQIKIWGGRKVFVASPSREIKSYLESQLKTQELTIHSNDTDHFGSDELAIKAAMEDFSTLLNCRYIVREPLSTFAALPSFIGGNLEAVYNSEGSLSVRSPSLLGGCAL